MNRSLAVKILLLVAVLSAAMWSVSAPRKHTPYASALETVTVTTARADVCGTKCSAPQHAICISAPPNKRCQNNVSGGLCLTSTCVE